MSRGVVVEFTERQAEVLHEALSMALNDPDWAIMLGSHTAFQTLGRAHERIVEARDR